MKSKLIKMMVFFVVLYFVSFASAGLELTLDAVHVDFSPGSVYTIDVVSFNELEDFTMYLDVTKLYGGFTANLWDCRIGELVWGLTLVIPDTVEPTPAFVLDNITLGIAAGDLGSFSGPYPIADGYRIVFNRNQSIGFAPDGVIGTVDLTFVPEPATILLLSIGGFLISRKVSKRLN